MRKIIYAAVLALSTSLVHSEEVAPYESQASSLQSQYDSCVNQCSQKLNGKCTTLY